MFSKTKLVSLFLIIFFLLSYCERVTAPIQQPRRELTTAEKSLVSSDNQFGVKLFKSIVSSETNKNIFISPLSVSMALGMTLNGAGGETRQAMESTLELQGLSQTEINKSYKNLIQLLQNLDPDVIFQIANSIWYRNDLTFKKPFIDLNQTYFDARVQGLNFGDPASKGVINQWVDENTNGKIKKIVDQINPLDIMFLINAIYFKGTWTYEFDKDMSKEEPFHLPDGSTVTCQLMHQSGKFRYLETDKVQSVDLPYGNGDFSMSIFLPAPQHNLDSLINQLSSEKLDQWMNSYSRQKGTIELPKFELDYKITLNNILSHLGMAIAFDPNQADFTKIYEGPERAYISRVNHKTYVNVDEEGTEAAAATSVTIGITSVGGDEFYFRADRPFLFLISERGSGTILFMGKIINPEA